MPLKNYTSSELYPLSKQNAGKDGKLPEGLKSLSKQIYETRTALDHFEEEQLSGADITALQKKLKSQEATYQKLKKYLEKKEKSAAPGPEKVLEKTKLESLPLELQEKLAGQNLNEVLEQLKEGFLSFSLDTLEVVDSFLGQAATFSSLGEETQKHIKNLRARIMLRLKKANRSLNHREIDISEYFSKPKNEKLSTPTDLSDESKLTLNPTASTQRKALVVTETSAKEGEEKSKENSTILEPMQILEEKSVSISAPIKLEPKLIVKKEERIPLPSSEELEKTVEPSKTQKFITKIQTKLNSKLPTVEISRYLEGIYEVIVDPEITEGEIEALEVILSELEARQQALNDALLADDIQEIVLEKEVEPTLEVKEIKILGSVQHEYAAHLDILADKEYYFAKPLAQRKVFIQALTEAILATAANSPRRQEITELQELLSEYAKEEVPALAEEFTRLQGELNIFYEKTLHTLEVVDKQGYIVELDEVRKLNQIIKTPEYYGNGLAQKYRFEEYVNTLSPSYLGIYEAEDKDLALQEYKDQVRGVDSELFVAEFFASPYAAPDIADKVFATQTTNSYTLLDDTYKADVLIFTKGETMTTSEQVTKSLNLVKDINQLLDNLGNKSESEFHKGNKLWVEQENGGEFYDIPNLNTAQTKELHDKGIFPDELVHRHVLADFASLEENVSTARAQYQQALAEILTLTKLQQIVLKKVNKTLSPIIQELVLSGADDAGIQALTKLKGVFQSVPADQVTRKTARMYLEAYLSLLGTQRKVFNAAAEYIQNNQLDFSIQGVQVKSGDTSYYNYIRPENDAKNETGVLRPVLPNNNPLNRQVFTLDEISRSVSTTRTGFPAYNEAVRNVLDLKKDPS